MANYCESFSKYHAECPEEAYSDDSPVHTECLSYADDAQYFDIDISLPFSPTDTSLVSSSDDDDGEEEFELDLSTGSADSPNPNLCISPADNLVDQSQLLPLQIPTPPVDDIEKDIAFPQSCNVPGVKIQFPKLLKTATKLKISLLGFRKSAKPGTDLQSPCTAEYDTGIAMDSPVPKRNKLLTVKLKVVEVSFVSLFTRDNSRGSKRNTSNHGFEKKSDDSDDGGQCKIMGRDKKKAKEIVQEYVKKIKPLYVKISQKCNDRMRFGGLEKSGERNGVKNGRNPGPERSEKQVSFSDFSGNLKQISFSDLSCNLKMAYKSLGKGKQQPSDMQQKFPSYGSESTWIEVQSAIQGAITHCKQSSYIDDTLNYQNSGCSAES